jgi:hypothetical protein
MLSNIATVSINFFYVQIMYFCYSTETVADFSTYIYIIGFIILDLSTYINSGAIECCLLGLATTEEEAMLDQMRQQYPELDSEISVVSYRLELAAMAGAVTPPAQVWQQISEQVNWQTAAPRRRRQRREQGAAYTVIDLQTPPQNRYMQVNIWWRCAVIALCMLLMVLLASSIYFYRKYHEMEERIFRAYPSTQVAPSSTK